MSQRWKRLGPVFQPRGERPWMQTHAAVPIAQHLQGDRFKVYFSSRDAQNRSHTGFVVIDLRRPTEILDLSATPVLAPGELGAFDDSGAMATWLVQHEGRSLMYYIGWNLGVTVPFRNAIGLAVSRNGADFVRHARGPIVDRSMDEPHFCASCCVVAEPQAWRMWYLSCTGWSVRGGKPMHHYHIKYAESDDGIHWRRDGTVAIDFANDEEYAISRPSVLRDAGGWKMWYSYRGQAYRIGYAESDDGKAWRRLDRSAGFDVAASGWDSEMIEYPFVFDHGGQRFMLYNGNGYGQSGFGLAVQETAP
jgi:hypothetical protein